MDTSTRAVRKEVRKEVASDDTAMCIASSEPSAAFFQVGSCFLFVSFVFLVCFLCVPYVFPLSLSLSLSLSLFVDFLL
jgi:hypothetical protein